MFYDTWGDDVSLHGGIPKQYSHLINHQFEDWEIAPWELKIFKNKKLGEGSWADVYLAKWKETVVVAKVMKNTDKKFLYIREFDNMTKMHHPNIVQLFGYVKEPFIIVMEYFSNKDLSLNINKLTKNQKKNITKDILKGLHYMHTRKPEIMIHRDIKPTNIMLTDSKKAKIVDFGLSKLSGNITEHCNLNSTLVVNSEHTTEVGSVRYMAPEIKSNSYDSKIDIYSTGILFYELFENKKYIPGNNFKFYWTPSSIKGLIINMTQSESSKRPTAKDCLYFLI